MRRRILIAIGGTLLVMLAIITAISRMILLESYDKLERAYIERDLQRVRADIDGQLDALATTTADYGAWTELYQYVKHPSPAFTDENFSDDSTKYVPVNVLLVFDENGKLLYGRQLRVEGKAGDVAGDLQKWIAAHPRFLDRNAPRSLSQGLVTAGGAILLAAARPIVDTAATIAPDGTLVMARVMDAAASAALSFRVALALDLFPLDGALPAAAARAVTRPRTRTRLSPTPGTRRR